MSVVSAFLLPHSREIISESDDEQISLIRGKYEEIADRIAELKPDTIVVISAHSEAYSDYFQIIEGEFSQSTFAKGEKNEFTVNIKYDKDLIKRICTIAKDSLFPAGSEGNQDRTLDHGAIVPLKFIQEKYSDFEVVRCSVSGLSLAEHYRFGTIIQRAANESKKKVIVIASGNLSHIEEAKGNNDYDEVLKKDLSNASFGALLEYDKAFLDKSKQCSHRVLSILAGCLDKTNVDTRLIHFSTYKNTGLCIAEFVLGAKNESRSFLSLYLNKERLNAATRIQNEDEFAKLAHEAIESHITYGRRISVPSDISSSLLLSSAGVFVSIYKFGQLRGCIGTINPQEANLAEEIISNAIAAATKDRRFPEVSVDEFPYLYIYVDVLNQPELVKDKSLLNPDEYGIIVSKGSKRGVLLPGAIGIDSVDMQINIAKRKASIGLDEEAVIERFTINRH